MSNWLNDKYEGEYSEGWYHGRGRLQMQNGVIYEGEFKKGEFDGEGRLIYPNGGYYLAQWKQGKMISGDYYFQDNLQYQTENWKHCIGEDRRYYSEFLQGIKPSGITQLTKQKQPPIIPSGTYDTGDGYYQPVKSIIYAYDGHILRTPTEQQVQFIVQKCRYVPKLVMVDGSKDYIIRKVIQKQCII